jgi:hypothetical protein
MVSQTVAEFVQSNKVCIIYIRICIPFIYKMRRRSNISLSFLSFFISKEPNVYKNIPLFVFLTWLVGKLFIITTLNLYNYYSYIKYCVGTSCSVLDDASYSWITCGMETIEFSSIKHEADPHAKPNRNDDNNMA